MKPVVFISLLFITVLFQGCSEDEPTNNTVTVSYLEITNPVMNSNVPDSTTIKIDTDINNLVRVELYIDQSIPSQQAVFKKPPYEYLWNTTYYEDGSQHILQAKAYDLQGDLTSSKYVIVNVYRFMPSNLQAFIRTDSLIELSWVDNCSFERGFEIEEAINDSDFVRTADVDSNTTTYKVVDTVELNNTYYFRMRAKAGDTFSGYTGIATATVLLNTPANTDISFIADTAATLSWTDNNDFETGYLIERYVPNVGYTFVKELPANTTETIVQDSFVIGQYYDYKIYAKMGYLLSQPAHFPYRNPLFPPPYELTLTGNNSNSLTLNWKYDHNYELGFIIERSKNGTDYFELGRTSSHSFTDNSLDTSFNYSYRIAAYSRYNKSAYSANIEALFSNQLKQIHRFLIPLYGISWTTLSYDASIIAFGGYTSNEVAVYIYDTFTGSRKFTLSNPDSLTNVFKQITISPDNRLLAAAGEDNYVTIWDINSGTVVKRINNVWHPQVMKFSFDGNNLIVERIGALRFYDIQSWQYETRINTQHYITNMDINSDETIIATGDGLSNVKLWDYSTGSLLREIPGSNDAYPLEFNRTGTKLYSVINTDLFAWDVNSASIILDIPNFQRRSYFAINEAKNIAASSYGYPRMGVWELDSGNFTQELSLDIEELFFTADNYLIGRGLYHPSYYILELTKSWISPIQ